MLADCGSSGEELVTTHRVMSEKRQQEVRLEAADRSQSGTFLEGRGLCCCQQTELVSGGSEGSGGSGEGGERRERGSSPLGEETPHALGSPPSETAGC